MEKRLSNTNYTSITENTNQVSNIYIYICKDGVIVPEATKKGYAIAKENDCIYINRPYQKRGVVQRNMIQTLKTNPNDLALVVINGEEYNLRFLTPRECMRCMGFTNEDYDLLVQAGLTRRQIEHMCGDSIVVPTLISIFSQFYTDNPDLHEEIINDYIEKEVIEQNDK